METSQQTTRWPVWVLPALTIIWFGCFVYLGVASRLPTIPGLTGGGESVALSGHFFTTLVLAWLVFALVRSRNLERPTWRVAVPAFVGATGAGALIEVLQSFSRTRTPELLDLGLDALGALVGIGVVAVFDRRPQFRPALISLGHALGASAVVLALSAFFLFPPIPPEEVTAYCPPTVEERRVSVASIEPGTGSRVADGLIALYPFGDSAADVSGLAPPLDLELVGGAGLGEGALRIEGGDAVAMTSGPGVRLYDAATSAGAFSVEAWVRPDDLLQRGPARIVSSSGSTDLGDVNFHLGQERTCLSFRIKTGPGAAAWLLAEGVFTSPQPSWHLAVTYDGGSIEVFVDGSPIDEFEVNHGPLSDAWDSTLPLLVGNEATRDRAFEGDIHLVAIYDRALEPEEVLRNYAAGANAG